MKVQLSILGGVMIALAGCAGVNTSNPLGSVTRSAGSAMGQVIGESMGQAAVAKYSPGNSAMYSARMMQLAFNSQGVSVGNATRDYAPGEYTEWEVTSSQDAPTSNMRRAFLSREDNGNEWWQVVYQEADSDEETVMEALFSPGRDELRRLRARYPDEDEASEVPVEEQSYTSPRQLTPESVAGATEGTEEIKVPAGSFKAQRVRFGTAGAEEVWWLSDEVPGGVVQYRLGTGEDGDEDAYTRRLSDFGTGAESRL